MEDSASIILQSQAPKITSPLDIQAKKSNIADAIQARQINQMKIDDYNLNKTKDSNIRRIMGEFGEDEAGPVLRAAGYYDTEQALNDRKQKMTKGDLEQQEQKYKIAKQHTDAISSVMGNVKDNPTPESLQSGLGILIENQIITPEQAQQKLQEAQSDPQGIAGWATRNFQQGLEAAKQLESFSTQNLGGTERTIATSPVTGAVRTVNEVQRTQSPDNIATNTRMVEENQKNRDNAIQVAGIRKSGEGTEKAPSGYRFNADGSLSPIPGGPKEGGNTKPLPPAALKMQQEDLDAIGTASAINSDLSAVQAQIDSGKLEFGPLKNLGNLVKNKTGMSDEKSRNFASFKTTLEKLRNDSLRLNKGVQTDGDAQRAWNELFDNISDQGVVKQRLAEIQRINERAVNLRKMNVDSVRANYGKEPLDTEGYESQPSALGGGQILPKNSRMDTKPGKVKTAADFIKANGL